MRVRLTATMLALALVVGGCGGDDDTDATSSADDVAADDAAVQPEPEPEPEPEREGGNEPEPESNGEPADEGDGGADGIQETLDDLDFGDGAARVVVGDTAYEFALGGNSTVGTTTYIGVCQTLFGLIAGQGYDPGGSDVTLTFEIPPPDWQSYDDGRFDTTSPKLEIEEGDTGGWVADMTLAESYPEAAGASQIDEWVSDETRASGTATFIPVEPFGAPVEGAEPVQGTFELGCATE